MSTIHYISIVVNTYLLITRSLYGKVTAVDRVLSVQQVAGRLGVTADMVRKAIRQGHLKAHSLSQEGRRPYYIVTEEALQEYERRPKGKPGRKPKSRVRRPSRPAA